MKLSEIAVLVVAIAMLVGTILTLGTPWVFLFVAGGFTSTMLFMLILQGGTKPCQN